MKVVKHCSSSFPSIATGFVVGMSKDKESTVEVTNSFPFPVPESTGTESHQTDPTAIAQAAPRAKANITYQNDMIRHLKEVNVDANTVGWYTSATMGNFVNLGFIENQFHYQKDNEKVIALVQDSSRSSQGALSLRAFKLSASFMAAFREQKFSTDQ